jgi:Barstar (barnase inhibitor)
VTSRNLPTAERSGIYRAPRELAPVRKRIGGRWCGVDLPGVRDTAALLAAIARACGFPPDFGCNWDALADALQEDSWLGSGPFVLNLRNTAPAAEALGDAWATLLEVLQFSLIYWKERGELFVVFVDGGAGLPSWQ